MGLGLGNRKTTKWSCEFERGDSTAGLTMWNSFKRTSKSNFTKRSFWEQNNWVECFDRRFEKAVKDTRKWVQ